MASDPDPPAPDPAPASQNPMDLLRSRSYLVLLVFGAIIGVPVAVIAYYFLKLVALGQKYFFTTLPGELGFRGQPPWWPVPVVAVGGLLVALTLHYLPGTGGHHPAEGFKAGGTAARATCRHRLRLPRHPDLRRRPGAGGAPDRDRRRRRRADRAPGQEGRAAQAVLVIGAAGVSPPFPPC